MATWNHRVIFFETPAESYYAVHEVYYDDSGKPSMYGNDPACALWDQVEGKDYGIQTLNLMLQAFNAPVLLATDFEQASDE